MRCSTLCVDYSAQLCMCGLDSEWLTAMGVETRWDGRSALCLYPSGVKGVGGFQKSPRRLHMRMRVPRQDTTTILISA